MDANAERLAADVARLARALAARAVAPVLISLARAGTPLGVLLRRALAALGVDAPHYSISIIRDRGVDEVALDWILSRHAPEAFVFVDGWTGKGAIAEELFASGAAWAASRGVQVQLGLVVVSDLAGVAWISASDDDYLIPNAVLNAVVSGLVSRTVLNAALWRPGDFHACVHYAELAPHDLTRWYVDRLTPLVVAALDAPGAPASRERAAARARSRAFVAGCMERFGVRDPNRVKPGIGESTRALLRRVPDRLILREPTSAAVLHLVLLAERQGVPTEVVADLPYQAAVLIRTLGRDS
jgi:hypothetical protein